MTQPSNPREFYHVEQQAVERLRQGQRTKALRILQDAGCDEAVAVVVTPPKLLVRHDFTCPAHQAKVVVPCQLQTCKFHLEYEMANNCVLAYCHQQGIDRLSAEEISYLYRIPLDTVRAGLDGSITDLRQQALAAEAATDPTVQRQFSFVETNKVCCVCGSITDDERIAVGDTPLAYCGKECASEKMPEIIRLEYRFGLPMRTVIRWAFRRFRNLPVLEKTLGLPRPMLIELCEQHVGRAFQKFFPKARVPETVKPRASRTSKTTQLAKTLSDAMRRLVEKTSVRYGPAVFQVADLRAELDALVALGKR